MQNSMQHPEILLCFFRPVELLLVQISFPMIPIFCPPILVANCQLTVAPSLLGAWAGVAPPQPCPPQCRALPRGGGLAWSHLQCHLALAVGSQKASGSPQLSQLLPGAGL